MKRMFCLMASSLLPLAPGCGSDFREALLLGSESGIRTSLDILLSDLYSDLPELFFLPPGPGEPVDGEDGGQDTGDMAEDGGDQTDGGGGGELVGNVATGMVIFTANSCFVCHCEDASGGCLPGAPNIQGKDFATIQERLQGQTPHPGGKFPELTDQDIADLEAFFAELSGS